MSKEAMKLALEALNVAEHFVEEYAASKYYFAHISAKTTLEEALAKQEHGEPVAWWVTGPDGEIDWSDEPIQYKEQRPLEELVDGCGYAPLYTTPQQRTWVGMTDEEIEMIVENKRAAHWEFIRQVEALLKEKNT